MRHHNNKRKFGRTMDQRNALMASLARALVKHGRIETTQAKAKELRPLVEKIVTKAGAGTVAARRTLAARLGDEQLVKKLVDEIAPQYRERPGGYTRIIKMAPRPSDNSPMAVIEFV